VTKRLDLGLALLLDDCLLSYQLRHL